MLKKIRQFLASALEYLGWGLIGPSVICGVYFISNILFAQGVASAIGMATFGIALLVTVVMLTDRSYPKSNEELTFSAGFVIWTCVVCYSAASTSVSISKTTLLVASIVYGAILVDRFFTGPTPEEYNDYNEHE